jgi:hypothetical protein
VVAASGQVLPAPETPFWARDQDVLNAILMSEVPAHALAVLPEDAEVYWDGLRSVDIVDRQTIACKRGGKAVSILHYSYRPKPWERRAWPRVTDDAFVSLLPRVLFGDDVPLRLDPARYPVWVRPGTAGRAAVRALDAGHLAVKAAINAPPEPIARRLLAVRHELFDRLAR